MSFNALLKMEIRMSLTLLSSLNGSAIGWMIAWVLLMMKFPVVRVPMRTPFLLWSNVRSGLAEFHSQTLLGRLQRLKYQSLCN